MIMVHITTLMINKQWLSKCLNNSRQIKILFIVFFFYFTCILCQEQLTVSRVKYDGGGDWYGNRTTFVNIFSFIRDNLHISTSEREQTVEISSSTLGRFPLLYIAGHGNIKFSDEEVIHLRRFLTSGGFLWADDDFGMDPSFRREMKKVFPESEWLEIPFSHKIYHSVFNFPNGLPKIHKHAGGPPKGLGLYYEGELVVFYSLNTDISDGCEDAEIHNDPPETRNEAIKMATNIIFWALMN